MHPFRGKIIYLETENEGLACPFKKTFAHVYAEPQIRRDTEEEGVGIHIFYQPHQLGIIHGALVIVPSVLQMGSPIFVREATAEEIAGLRQQVHQGQLCLKGYNTEYALKFIDLAVLPNRAQAEREEIAICSVADRVPTSML